MDVSTVREEVFKVSRSDPGRHVQNLNSQLQYYPPAATITAPAAAIHFVHHLISISSIINFPTLASWF